MIFMIFFIIIFFVIFNFGRFSPQEQCACSREFDAGGSHRTAADEQFRCTAPTSLRWCLSTGIIGVLHNPLKVWVHGHRRRFAAQGSPGDTAQECAEV
jgi:hypothetical protein